MEAKKKGNLSEPIVAKPINPAPTTAGEKDKDAPTSDPKDSKKEPTPAQPTGPNAPEQEKPVEESMKMKQYTGSEANETFKFYREYKDIVTESELKKRG